MSGPPAKKRKGNNGNFWAMDQFADVDADEGPDDEEWDDEIDQDIGDKEFERHARDIQQREAARARELNSDIPSNRNNGQFESRPNILDRLTQKYVRQNDYNVPDDMSSVVESSYPSQSHHATYRNTMAASSVQQPSYAQSQRTYAPTAHHGAPISVEMRLPSVQDPNLWLVPCLPGKERFAVGELLKKYFKYLHHPKKKLFIQTAFTTDMNTGYIYVEAYKEIHVRRACEDISGLNTWKLRLVPRNEMVDALTIKTAGPQIKRGQWCRFQRGLYKGDLAQVYAIMEQGSKVVLRVVPRIDYGKLSAIQNMDNGHQRSKPNFMRRGRPPQKLFDRNEIEMYCSDNTRPETIYPDAILKTKIIRWKSKKYKNGCHLVTTPVNQVEFDVTAAPEEVSLLRSKTGDDDYEDDGDEDMDEVAPPIFQKTCQFVRGDTVKVIRGAMTNLIGEVLTTQPNPVSGKITVTVLPEHKDLMGEAIMFPSEELQKFFKVGCHVKVKRGKFKDETGLIIKVEDEKADSTDNKGEVIIFSDLTSRTIRVHINDITETSEVSTGRDVLGNYALYELVHLSRDVVGVIVSIQNGTFKILDNKDQIQTCRLPDIARHSRDEHAVALDIDNNQIRIGDVIIPQVGDFKSQRATVKHVYRSVLFCHTKSCTVNSGIFVCRSRLCRLAGGRLRNNNSSTIQGRSDTKNDRRLRILHKHRSSRDPWMHKTVKVKKGPYKGMIGIVCSCTDQKLNIELHAKCKKIQIKRENVKVINKDGSDVQDDNTYNKRNDGYNRNNGMRNNNGWNSNNNNRSRNDNNNNHWNSNRNRRDNRRDNYGHQAQTPLIGVSTPAYNTDMNRGGATPAMLGNSTPAYGGQTPGYGGLTPAYTDNQSHGIGNNSSSAWNPGGMTPAHSRGAMTPLSPDYSNNHNSSIHSSNAAHSSSYSQNTPSTHPYTPHVTSPAVDDYSNSNNYSSNTGGTTSSHHLENEESDSQQSTSENGDIDRAIAQNPYYFIVENAILKWRVNGNDVIVSNVDTMQKTCSVAYTNQPSMIIQDHVSFNDIEHSIPQNQSSAPVKVVFGKMSGEVGNLIGIDNEEAVVQMSSTSEVTIVHKKLVVCYHS